MNIQHPQENIIKTYNYNGITVDLVEWNDTIWCGKIDYADNNIDEPNVEKIMEDFMSTSAIPNSREDNWDICMSVNYLSNERPSGVMFGFLVETDVQPNSYDIYKIPTTKFLRIRMCDETARALGHEPWIGGIPPYHWIGEQIAPKLGYTYGNDILPVVEYYGFFKPEEGTHEYCYLYVPVKESNAMDIEFRKITDFPRGTLCALLKEGYSFEPRFERDCLNQWQEFDKFFYDNPHIAEFSGFMTVLSDVPIGFVSWNPTNIPISAEIGHNCIAAKYKGNGYGKQQMQEAVRRIIAQGAKKIIVTTNEILIPAQRTYESAGFKFINKCEEPNIAEYAGMRINYEIIVK